MSILINREVMAVHAKHTSAQVLSRLAHIELAHRHVVILDEDRPESFSAVFTPYELKLLYRSLYRAEPASMLVTTLATQVSQAAVQMGSSALNGFEVEVQARSVTDTDKKRYRYVPGSHLPSPQDELFEPAAWGPQSPALVMPTQPKTTAHQAPKTLAPNPTPTPGGQSPIKPPWLR
jgi:hypothetical protein